MQSLCDYKTVQPVRGSKQVKVDNWGTFFLQRLLQLYFNEELLDLKIKFRTTNNILNVHRLVVSTCTDYFLRLEQKQNDGTFDKNVIIMPSDMPYECVKLIISFMYTGQLEYRTSDQNALYHTAQKMNMNVLTKLLDTQLEKDTSQNNSLLNVCVKSTSIQEPFLSKMKQFVTSPSEISMDKPLPTTERIKDDQLSIVTSDNYNSVQLHEKYSLDNTEGPSRFDIPEIEDMTLGVFSSFDDITYNTKPIMQASEGSNKSKVVKNVLTDALSNKFMDTEDDQNFLRDQCKRSICSDTNSWLESESTIELDDVKPSSVKKFRYNFNEKENHKKAENVMSIQPIHSVSNHAKIIREVLKKYPHLVQRNKNIRLKIMQKESKSSEGTYPGKTKISYVVLTSDSLQTDLDSNECESENRDELILDNNENGPWKCTKCDLEENYTNYSQFRRHMQGVHGFKFDPKTCEYCGYKATKRNILMYHMYTKHDVQLPKNISFPRCNLCSYTALSESLLLKHQANNHKDNVSSFNVQNFVNVTELGYDHVASDHELHVNDTEKNNDNTFYNENLEKQEDSYQKDNCLFDISTPSNLLTDNKNSENLLNERIISVDNINDVNQCNIDERAFKTFKIETESPDKLEMENLQNLKVKEANLTSSNDQDGEEIDCSINNLTNNKILIHNLKDNMVIYVQNNEYLDSSQNSNESIKYQNSQYSLDSHKIMEKIDANIEAIDCENQPSTSNLYEKKDDCKEQNIVNQNDYFINCSENNSTFNTKDVIQYIEEETEILEYETCNNV